MKKNSWIVKALILGFSFFIAVFLIKPIGVSTQFSVLSGMIHRAVDPTIIELDEESESGYYSRNEYYNKDNQKIAESIVNPINYDFVFVLAIPLGAILGHLIMKKKKVSTNEIPDIIFEVEEEPKEKEGFIKTYVPTFAAGMLLLFGARLADGCTSGHMMSGLMQSSVSGLLFMISVFAVAVPVAIIKRRKSIKEVR